MSATCPWCDAPRQPGPTCPRCGANYAKAEAIRTHGRAGPAAETPGTANAATGPSTPAADVTIYERPPGVDDPRLELRFCIWALPIMLGLALLIRVGELGHFLQRTFLGMPVHELGHAITAWLCGYTAIPTLWKTLVPETRGVLAPVVLGGAVVWSMYRAWHNEQIALLPVGGAVLLLQAIGTLGIRQNTAEMLVTFGGDGMGMVLATALMTTFFFGKGTQLYRGSLRWGFLVIGAAAFVDMFGTWWAAWRDHTDIPFGLQEGVGLSDASKLAEWHGWSQGQLVDRYMLVGVCCLLALSVVYAWGVWQASQAAAEAERLGRGAAKS